MVDKTFIYTYSKWIEDPSLYGEEMLWLIDKLIYKVISENGNTVYTVWGLEDKEDVIQDLRLLLLNKLREIKDPSNKRIYNFLKSHVYWALKIKRRTLKKNILNHAKMEKPVTEKTETYLFLTGDNTLQHIASLLIQGYTAKEIKSKLNISTTNYKKYIERIKVQLV